MRLAQITEARYYKRPSRDEVVNQYTKAEHNRGTNNVKLMSIEVGTKWLWGDIVVHASGGANVSSVTKEITQFLNKMEVPFDRIYDVGRLNAGQWGATSVLDLDDAALTEAKYYQKYPATTVYEIYQKLGDDYTIEDTVYMATSYMSEDGKKAYGDVDVRKADGVESAMKQVKAFMKHRDVPYNDIGMIGGYAESGWSIAVSYEEQS